MSKEKEFKREDSHKKKGFSKSWRRARGRHSNVRLEKNGAPAKPKAGYRTPKEVRGKHPSGYDEVMVNNTSDLEVLDPETEAARIASSVGKRKRNQITEKAEELEIHVLNTGEKE